MNILIIEDEAHMADELEESILSLLPSAKILNKLKSISGAIQWLESNNTPDLIFSDIQLSDGHCFEIFKQFNTIPVVFCTFYDHFALEAFDNNGIAYIVKPIDTSKLQRVFEKLDNLKYHKDIEEINFINKVEQLFFNNRQKVKQTLLSYFRDQIIPISVNEIYYIYTEKRITFAQTKNKKYEIKDFLDNLIRQLDQKLFFRVNRQCIIHRQAIESIEILFNRKLLVKTINNLHEGMVISKEKSVQFLNWMEDSFVSQG